MRTQADHMQRPEARTGRDKQRYDATTGARLVAVGIPLMLRAQTHSHGLSGIEVLVVTSRKHGSDRWTFPKGGWEKDETAVQAAVREVYEEGGAVCEPLASFPTAEALDLLSRAAVPVFDDESMALSLAQGPSIQHPSQLPVLLAQKIDSPKRSSHAFFLLGVNRLLEQEEFPEGDERRRQLIPIEHFASSINSNAVEFRKTDSGAPAAGGGAAEASSALPPLREEHLAVIRLIADNMRMLDLLKTALTQGRPS